jgi:hypothetical protein
VILARKERKDIRAIKASKVLLDQLVRRVFKVRQELVLRAHKASRVLKAFKVLQDLALKVRRVYKVLLALKAHRALLAQLVLLVRKASKVRLVQQVHRVCRALQALKVFKVQLAPLVLKAFKVRLVHRAFKALLDQEPKARKVCRELKVSQVQVVAVAQGYL